MLPLDLFRRRNFTVGNARPCSSTRGWAVTFFLLTLFLQEVSGFTPLEAGAALLPVTFIMFLFSRASARWPIASGRAGSWAVGPIVAGIGLLLFSRLGAHVNYLTDVLPGALIFGLGLTMTVAPLTATVLGGVDEEHASLASGVNNAIARVAGLLAIARWARWCRRSSPRSLDTDTKAFAHDAGVPAAVRSSKAHALSAQAPASVGPHRAQLQAALTDASEDGFRVGMLLMAVLVIAGGVISAVGIVNPRREVKCADCPGGALAGATQDAGRASGLRDRDLPRVKVPQRVGA